MKRYYVPDPPEDSYAKYGSGAVNLSALTYIIESDGEESWIEVYDESGVVDDTPIYDDDNGREYYISLGDFIDPDTLCEYVGQELPEPPVGATSVRVSGECIVPVFFRYYSDEYEGEYFEDKDYDYKDIHL